MRTAVVKQLDFGEANDYSKNNKNWDRKHPDIDADHLYIGLISGRYYIGPIRGHNFHDGWGNIGHQFDFPGCNGCNWQRVWRVDDANGLNHAEAILLAAGIDPVQVAIDDEMRYAKARRQYCIDHRMTWGDRQITEESPIEAWLYKPTAETMPKLPGDDD